MSVEDALSEAANEMIAKEIAEDVGCGQDRILPSSFRQVLYFCLGCGEHAAATSDGPMKIDSETARRLLEGAEVLDLCLPPSVPPRGRPAVGAAETPAEEPNCPIWDNVKTEVVENPQTHKKSAMVEISTEIVQHTPLCFPPSVPPRGRLSTPDRSLVPPEKRDIPLC